MKKKEEGGGVIYLTTQPCRTATFTVSLSLFQVPYQNPKNSSIIIINGAADKD